MLCPRVALTINEDLSVMVLTWNALPGPGMLMGTGRGALFGPAWVGVAAPLLGALAGLGQDWAPEAVAYVTLS